MKIRWFLPDINIENFYNNIQDLFSCPYITDERAMISADYSENYWFSLSIPHITDGLPAFADFLPIDDALNIPPGLTCTPRDGGDDGLTTFQAGRESEEQEDPAANETCRHLIDNYPDSPWSGHTTAAVRRLSDVVDLPATRDYLFDAAGRVHIASELPQSLQLCHHIRFHIARGG